MYRAITAPAPVERRLLADHRRRGADLRCSSPLAAWQPVPRPRPRRRSCSTARKAPVHLAALAGFLVWFVGFMVIGGEWFLMWQSETWNGQEPAFRFYLTILAVLIYVNQPDGEPA